MEIPAELVALSGTAIAAFLGLSMLFALLRRPHKTFHRYFAHLALYAAVVHGVLVLLSDPEALRALNAEEISGLTAMGGLIVTMATAAGRAPRRHRAATTAARTRSARAWRTRHPLAARLLHWLPGICTVAALTVHVILVQDSTFHRWLWIIVCEGVALVMIGRYVIPHPLRLRRRGKPRHQITPETPTAQVEHATKVIHQTAPLILRPEKRVVNYRKIGITTPDQIPTCLTYSPHTLLVALRDKTALLTHRREIALAGGKARFLRSMDDLRRALPASPEDREISEYVVCGDPVFLTDVHEFLAHAGVPHNRIHTETSPSHIDLPADHPSARIGSIKEHVFRR